jgi:hypothetical protein
MKNLSTGLVLLLAGILVGALASYMTFTLARPYDELLDYSTQEWRAYYRDINTSAMLGLLGAITSFAGTAIFLMEFARHEHKS